MSGANIFIISFVLLILTFGFYISNDKQLDVTNISGVTKTSAIEIQSDKVLHLIGGILLGVGLVIFKFAGFFIGWSIIIIWEVFQGLTGTGKPELADILAGGAAFTVVFLFLSAFFLRSKKPSRYYYIKM